MCAIAEPIEDPAVDILSINVFDPAPFAIDHDGYLVRIGLGSPANETFANDYSGALLGAFAPIGASAYTLFVNQVHALEFLVGILDESGQEIVPGTEDSTFIEEFGNIWYMIPGDTTFMLFSSFHLPSEELAEDQKRCDIAPDFEQYTLDLP